MAVNTPLPGPGPGPQPAPRTARVIDAAGITDPQLRSDLEACRRLNAEYGRTYYLATGLLPAERRPWVWALYGFARAADQLVDSSPQPDRSTLLAWSDQVRAALEGAPGRDPVTRAMVATCRRWHIPPAQVDAFLEAMATDLDVTSYATYADLQRYMYGSAEVVGLWMLPLLSADSNVTPGELEEPARRLGEAFQLTNFVRDVGEDLDLGRVYLPAEDLDRFGVTRDDLLAVRRGAPMTDSLRALLAFEAQRCRRLYDEAAPGVERLDPVARPAIRAALVLYREILERVEASDFPVLTRRVTVPRVRRAAVALPALLAARRERRHRARERGVRDRD